MRKKVLIPLTLLCMAAATPLVWADDSEPPISPDNPFTSAEVVLLRQIETTLSSIGNTLNAIAMSLFTAPTNVGQYIHNMLYINTATQLQSEKTHSYSDQLAQYFQATGSLNDTVDHAYSLSTEGSGDYGGLSAYSLLGETKYGNNYSYTYSADQAKAADTYATFLAGAAIAMPQVSDASTTKDKQNANMARTLAAIQSLDAYNISRIYASRLPEINAQDNGIDIPTPDGNVSQADLLRYQIFYNINNPDWYKDMSEASGTIVQRQMLFLLAAAVSELYRIEQNQNQLLLTQTATNTATIATAQAFMQAMNSGPSIKS